MSRALIAIGVLGLGGPAIAAPAAKPKPAFPPTWRLGDHWRVVMRTVAPHAEIAGPNHAPAPLEPIVYAFRVIAVPDRHGAVYRLDARPVDPTIVRASGYTLDYRRDFSLAKIAVIGDAGARATEPPDLPFVDPEHYRLAIVADFPIAPAAHRDTDLGDRKRLVQDVDVSAERTRITLQALEPSGSVRVELEWLPGRPWWSTIVCTEEPPAGVGSAGYVVASGEAL